MSLEIQNNGPQLKRFWVEQGYSAQPTIANVEQFFADARDQPVPSTAAFSIGHDPFTWASWLHSGRIVSSDDMGKAEFEKDEAAYREKHPHEWTLRIEWSVEVDAVP